MISHWKLRTDLMRNGSSISGGWNNIDVRGFFSGVPDARDCSPPLPPTLSSLSDSPLSACLTKLNLLLIH